MENSIYSNKSDFIDIKEIFSLKYDMLLSFGLRITKDRKIVEDSIQDLFLVLCEKTQLLQKARDIDSYLKISLKHTLVKKLSRERNSEFLDNKLVEISIPSYEDTLIRKQKSEEEAIKLKAGLAKLTNSQKTILTLRFYRGMSYEEIAEKMDCSKRTVYNQVHEAMKRMRKQGS